VLEESRKRHRFVAIELIDVDTDPALVAEYGELIPVVAVDGKIRFKGQVNPALLERLLSALSVGGAD
jgi:hypothetical protein